MAFNGSGIFERLYSWVTDRDAGTKIIADRVDAETDGIVAGINSVVDGTQGFIAPVRGSNGTAAAPGHSFTDDTNTGMYRVSTDVLGFSVAGTLEGQFEAGYFDAVNGLKIGGVAVTSTAAELNILDGATVTTAEINLLGDFVGTFTLPVSDGTDGQVLTTDGAGGLLFEDATGGGPDIQEFTASGTWTKPAGVATVIVRIWGAGGGGGSGRLSATAEERSGGTGGGGGGFAEYVLNAGDLSATETVTIGAGGSGGAAQTSATSDGNVGSAGGSSGFSSASACHARGGFGGKAGTTSDILGGAGGWSGLGAVQISGQADQVTYGGNETTAGNSAGKSYFGGGQGGGTVSTSSAYAGGSSVKGAGGGGAGGGITAGGTHRSGGLGEYGAGNDTTGRGTKGSAGGSNGTTGGWGCGGGGGGGNSAGAGGAGAAGGSFGGGGGGGGAGSTTSSGAGGDGGDGYCVVISF